MNYQTLKIGCVWKTPIANIIVISIKELHACVGLWQALVKTVTTCRDDTLHVETDDSPHHIHTVY